MKRSMIKLSHTEECISGVTSVKNISPLAVEPKSIRMKHLLQPVFIFVIVANLLVACKPQEKTEPVAQKKLTRVDAMANVPQPFKIIDFEKLAKDFDKTVYDFNQGGEYWPLIWMDSSRKNFDQPVAGIYTAIGDVRQGPKNNKAMFHESLATMGAVLGASLVGIDKSAQQYNYVSMLKNYFNRETGWNIMMNNTAPEVALLGGGYGRDWWYDVFPNVLFYAIYDLYPDEPDFETLARTIAEKFYQADSVLNGNYDYTYFDYAKMKPHVTHICKQPDAAAGHAWVLYSAYKKFKDPRYLQAAQNAMRALESQKVNPTYELLMPFGAYMAARLNAETGSNFDVQKMLEWSFDGTAVCREGWGTLVGNWNGFDISGTVGSTVHNGGYGFLMNTYDQAWPLIPMVRYNQAYAVAIGKWMLNAANAAKLFYPQYMPKEHQTVPDMAAVTKGVIGYEGIIKKSVYQKTEHLAAPVAIGDGPLWVKDKNPEVSQFSVYGSGHVGIFGSIIRPTNVPEVLQLDLLATDFFRDTAYPSYLYYNPLAKESNIAISNATGNKIDLYNTITGTFIAKNVSSEATLKLNPGEAAVLVFVPANSKITYDNNKTMANGIVINYNMAK